MPQEKLKTFEDFWCHWALGPSCRAGEWTSTQSQSEICFLSRPSALLNLSVHFVQMWRPTRHCERHAAFVAATFGWGFVANREPTSAQ